MFDAAKFTLDPVAFTIRIGNFTKEIYWYGIIIAAALLAGILLAMKNARFRKLNSDIILDLVLITVPFALVGARVYYVIFMWNLYVEDVWYLTLRNIVAVWEGGLAIYGGVIGGLAGLAVFARWRKVPFLALCDIAAPSLILGQAIGRWGNFVNQEAFGYEVSNSALHFFPFSVYIEATGTYHMATFFYESMWNLLVFAALLLYLRKVKEASPGNVFFGYLALYGLGRMFIEPMRTDSLYIPGTSLRASQILSAALLIGSVAALLFRNMKRPERSGKPGKDEAPGPVNMRQIDPGLVLVEEEFRHRRAADSGDDGDDGDNGDDHAPDGAGEAPAAGDGCAPAGIDAGEPGAGEEENRAEAEGGEGFAEPESGEAPEPAGEAVGQRAPDESGDGVGEEDDER